MESKCDAASISVVILDVVTSSSHHEQWSYLALQSAGVHVCYVPCVCVSS